MSAVRDAIVTKLQATSAVTTLATKIWPGVPPEDKSLVYPLVSVTPQKSPTPERVFQGGGTNASTIAFEESVYLVRACDRSTSPKSADDVNTQIKAALDGASLTITGQTQLVCEWVGDYETNEHYSGQTYFYAGGFYRVWAK